LPDTPKQILLAFMWARIESKAELIPYLEAIQDFALSSNGQRLLADVQLQEEFSNESNSYTSQDYAKWIEDFRGVSMSEYKGYAKKMLTNPEWLSFISYGQTAFQENLPLPVSQGTAKVHSAPKGSHPESDPWIEFPDCVETALRNFFNILLFDSKRTRFDVQLLNDVSSNWNLDISQSLVEYYQRYALPTDMMKSSSRNDWSQNVVSHLNSPPVRYLQQDIELASEMDNVLGVIENLLFAHFRLPDGRGFHDLSPQEKWKLICQIFSRSGWTLRMVDYTEDSKTHKTVVNFAVNSADQFTWSFTTRHSHLEQSGLYRFDWKTSIYPEVLQLSVEAIDELDRNPGLERSSDAVAGRNYSAMLPWFADPPIFRSLDYYEKLNLPLSGIELDLLKQRCLFSVPIGSQENGLSEIEVILKKQWKNLYPAVSRMIQKIDSDGLEVLVKALDLLLRYRVECQPDFASESFERLRRWDLREVFVAAEKLKLKEAGNYIAEKMRSSEILAPYLVPVAHQNGSVRNESLSLIHYMMAYGSPSGALKLMDQLSAKELSQEDANGTTLLQRAIERSEPQLVLKILDQVGVQALFKRNKNGVVPLEWVLAPKELADFKARCHFASVLLDRVGIPKIAAYSRQLLTELFARAVVVGSLELVQKLVPFLSVTERNAQSGVLQRTPLMVALEQGHYDVVRYFLLSVLSDADLNVKNVYQENLVHLAVVKLNRRQTSIKR
jgi:hypothetical protein